MRRIDQDKIITIKDPVKDATVQIGFSTVVGTREKQEDAVLALSQGDFYIAAVCDGMGGLNNGDVASGCAVEVLKKDFLDFEMRESIPDFLRYEAIKIDKTINELKDEEGRSIRAGTTIVAIIIFRKKVYWMSVGDSKIWFIRDGRFFPLTREHNYLLSLDILKRRGMISEEDYLAESEKGEALISYLGMGNLSLIDCNIEGIPLEYGDKILLCSDGLYKTVGEEEILSVIQKYRDAQDAADALTASALNKKNQFQDNTSVVLVQHA